MKLSFMTLSAAILLAATVSNAEEWSYDDCLQYAMEHNISLQQSRLNEELSEFTLEASKAQWTPSINFTTTHNLTDQPWADNKNSFYQSSYGLNAGWTVWNGGERENTIKRNNLQISIDAHATDDIIRSLETELLSIYINILYAHESISIYQDAVELSRAQTDRARQLMDAGRLSRVDYTQLVAQYEQDRYSLVNAEGDYNSKRMELKQLLELGINNDITPKDIEWTSEQVLAELPPIEESYRLAIVTDSQLKAKKLENESAELDIKIAKAGYYPELSLNAGIGTNYSSGNAWGKQMKEGFNESVGITLAVPIMDNKKTKTAVAKARVQQISTQLEYDARLTELAQAVEHWYIDLSAAQSRYKAGLEQERSASLSNELVNEQFRLGLVNTIELMTAHNNLLEARHSLLQAKYMAMLSLKMIEFYRTATISMP